MTLVVFFSPVPTTARRHRLTEFLGAAQGGLIECGHGDAVKRAADDAAQASELLARL